MSNNMTQIQIDDYYMRWREVMLVVAKRQGILVCNKKHEGYFRDAIDRLKEDPWWILQSASIEATMMAHPDCPEDELLIWLGWDKPIVRMHQFLGTKKGFGSFNKIMAPTAEGVVGFDEAFDKLKPQ